MLKVAPRNLTERNLALHMYENHFCLILKSQGVSFKKTKEELKLNCKIIDNVMSDTQVKIFLNVTKDLKKFNLNQLT